jgi:hypothetical protein
VKYCPDYGLFRPKHVVNIVNIAYLINIVHFLVLRHCSFRKSNSRLSGQLSGFALRSFRLQNFARRRDTLAQISTGLRLSYRKIGTGHNSFLTHSHESFQLTIHNLSYRPLKYTLIQKLTGTNTSRLIPQ